LPTPSGQRGARRPRWPSRQLHGAAELRPSDRDRPTPPNLTV
jgi:hypothetical protein